MDSTTPSFATILSFDLCLFYLSGLGEEPSGSSGPDLSELPVELRDVFLWNTELAVRTDDFHLRVFGSDLALTARLGRKNLFDVSLGRSVFSSKDTTLVFEGGAWLMLRMSGTEPLLRIYCEAESDEAVDELLTAGRELAGV